MFAARISYSDKSVKDCVFSEKREALAFMNAFSEINGPFENVAVIDSDSNEASAILPFKDGRPVETVKLGMVARMREEYSEPEERDLIYVISGINEATGRVTALCVNSGLTIPPAETVGAEMVAAL